MRVKACHFISIFLLLLATSVPAVPSALRVTEARDAALTILPDARDSGHDDAVLRLAVHIPTLGERILWLEPNLRLLEEARPFLEDVAEGRVVFYRGGIEGQGEGWVRLSRIHDEWIGLIHDGKTLWLIDPASHHIILAARYGVPPDGTLVFGLDDISGLGHFHGDARLTPRIETLAEQANGTSSFLGTSTKYLRVSLVLDTEFQARWGSNAHSTAVGILNSVDGFYTQANTQVSLHALQALSSNGTMTSANPNALLDAFSAYSAGGNVPFHGLAHLLSGKDFDGSTVGLAYVGDPRPGYVSTVCNANYGTGIDQITASSALGAVILAHEMGHNYGAVHDGSSNSCAPSGFIMAPSVNSNYNSFSSCTLSEFMAYQAAKQPACLVGTSPVGVIFANGFE